MLERWITPSLFEGTDAHDEYSFMQTEGSTKKLRDHQKTFITEADFRWMRDNGINAVRIPVGYWVLRGDGPLRSAIGRLDWAVRMAEKYDIRVLVCLHGAPGSQNGHDHSGKAGAVGWFDSVEYRQQTVDILRELAERYSQTQAVWGIELLNEPQVKLWHKTLREFYKKAYREICGVGRKGLAVVYSDAFMPRMFSGALQPHPDFPLYMDHHWYHFFIPAWIQPHLKLEWYYRYLRYKGVLFERLGRAQPVIIGEWSAVIGGERIRTYPKEIHEQLMDQHVAVQLEAFRSLAGWFYWSYKHEHGGIFNFKDMVDSGRIKNFRRQ